jgi:hypothetical protein
MYRLGLTVSVVLLAACNVEMPTPTLESTAVANTVEEATAVPEPTPEPIATNETTAAAIKTAETVLREIAETVCPIPAGLNDNSLYHRFSSTDTTAQFECSPAAGHSTVTTMSWFGSLDEADAAFAARREERMVTEFHGFPLLMWEEDHPSFPGGRKESQIWLWQADQWLIEIYTFDDTNFEIAPGPERVADAIYRVGQKHDLFAVSE